MSGRRWKDEYESFRRAVEEAQEKRKSALVKALYSGINKGSTVETVTVRVGDGPDGRTIGFEETKTTIDHGAKARYAMWALPRIDPENWSDKAQVEKLAQAKFRESIQFLMGCVSDSAKTEIATALMATGFEVSAAIDALPSEAPSTDRTAAR